MDKLKPSQLLRLGAKQVPQIKGDYFDVEYDDKNKTGKIFAACAMGMMVIGKTGTLDYRINTEEMRDISKELEDRYHIRPCQVTHLNDAFYKTPEEIAQWLEKKGC